MRTSVPRAASGKLRSENTYLWKDSFFHGTAASGSVYASVICGGLGVAVPDKPKYGFEDVVVGNEEGGAPHLEDRGAGEAGEGCPGPAENEGADAGAAEFKFARLSEMEFIFKLKDNQLHFRFCFVGEKNSTNVNPLTRLQPSTARCFLSMLHAAAMNPSDSLADAGPFCVALVGEIL
ncbi:hypothetical protein L211DRAFT_641691 [Terfezia boudieri ATCC MYA-4762]|uniref:Uncharacterized protein n=1 Tax=Terfezia boudieri ATCC MYA-4762 TaxID=1051890 RepID=A0A3N4LC24_9PEZI|nr:hypothetical protein L211DRAFT_641691 [Terfezia boudieri ATCC MYA-4762]